MKDGKMTQVASRFKYQQLYEMIRNDIEDGDLKAGDKLPGQRELMSDNKLSYATVNTALQKLEEEGYIFRKHGCGTFVRGIPASEAKARALSFGMMMPRIYENPSGVLKGIFDGAHEMGIKLEFILYEGAKSRMVQFRNILQGNIPVAGLLIMHRQGYDDLIQKLENANFPYLVVDTPCLYTGVNHILLDHEKGAEDAVNHLIEHGHTRIATIAGPSEGPDGSDWSRAKFNGYRRALGKAGLPFEDSLVVQEGELSAEAGMRAAKRLLAKGDFSALFVATAVHTSGAIDALRAAGREVPRDIAVTSFNVVEYDDCADAQYSVSGINVPREAAGRAAVEFLAEITNGDYTQKPFIRELDLALIKRRSCGCA